jgi:hypothetical protein
MASRNARRQRAQQAADQRTTAARRVEHARTEIDRRSLQAAAVPLRDDLPDFYATALLTGVVPEPFAAEAWNGGTTLLPAVQPRTLLGLNDYQEGQDK